MQQRCRGQRQHRRDADPGCNALVAELAGQHRHKSKFHRARDQLDAVQRLVLGPACRQQ